MKLRLGLRSSRPVAVVVACAAVLSLRCGSSGSHGSSEAEDGGSTSGAIVSSASGSSGATTSSGVGTSSGSATSSGTAGSSSGSASTGGGTATGGEGGTGAGTDAGMVGGSQSVLMRGHDVYTRDTYTEPGLTLTTAPMMAPDATFNGNATFPGNGGVGSPSVLYLEDGPAAAGCPTGANGCKATTRPAGNGLFFAFVTGGGNPNVYAFDETSGLPVWNAMVTNGTPRAGDGIRGTPAIDPVSRRVFIVDGPNPHVVHALSVDTGIEVTGGGWPVTLSQTTVSSSGVTFNSNAPQNQHGALFLLNDILYIPFGGEIGDGGNYRGWIISVDITNPTHLGAWVTQSAKSGIWAAGGLSSDGTNVFVETGNAPGGAGTRAGGAQDSEEVVRLSGMSVLDRTAANVFVANEWSTWDDNDRDLGACSPAFVSLPAGSTPASLLIAPAKPGVVYFLDGTNLSQGAYNPATFSNTNGQLAEVQVSNLAAEAVYTSPTVYTSASGLHAAINVGRGGQFCPNPKPTTDEVVISTLIKPGTNFGASISWCVGNAAGSDNCGGKLDFPPISTTSDGVSADPIVWVVTAAAGAGGNCPVPGTQLMAINGDSGDVLATTSGADCNNIPTLSFPIAVKNRIVVSALGHLCSWSVNGM